MSQKSSGTRPVAFAIIALLLLGVATPFIVRSHKNSQIADSEAAALESIKTYIVAQDEYFAKNKYYASTLPALGLSELNSGYHFTILTAQGAKIGRASCRE